MAAEVCWAGGSWNSSQHQSACPPRFFAWHLHSTGKTQTAVCVFPSQGALCACPGGELVHGCGSPPGERGLRASATEPLRLGEEGRSSPRRSTVPGREEPEDPPCATKQTTHGTPPPSVLNWSNSKKENSTCSFPFLSHKTHACNTTDIAFFSRGELQVFSSVVS